MIIYPHRKDRPSLNILDDVGMKDFKVSLYEVMKRLQSKQANIYSVQVFLFIPYYTIRWSCVRSLFP